MCACIYLLHICTCTYVCNSIIICTHVCDVCLCLRISFCTIFMHTQLNTTWMVDGDMFVALGLFLLVGFTERAHETQFH